MKGFVISVLLVLSFLLQYCHDASSSIDKMPSNLIINLKWHPAYPQESQADVETGLLWVLAYLGESITEKDYLDYMTWIEPNLLQLDLTDLIDDPQKRLLWKEVLTEIKLESDDPKHHSVDVGKFVFETFNESDTYYQLTGMPTDLNAFKSFYDLDDEYRFSVAKGESCVAFGFRMIGCSQANELTELGYIAQEGTGSSISDFTAEEFEVFDFMENGQPRFGIYNTEGNLMTGANPEVTIAGKPAKCMWCHTSQVQPLIFAATNIDGFETMDSFSTRIHEQNVMRRRYLRKHNYDFAIDSLRQHSLAELLYFTYEYPTPQRLASEGIESDKIMSLDYHDNIEYRFFGLEFDSMVHRYAVDPTFKKSSRETYWEE